MKIATILLLTSLSSSNAETSFLRASISNDGDGDALRCLGECADEDIYNGKKKHPTKKKVLNVMRQPSLVLRSASRSKRVTSKRLSIKLSIKKSRNARRNVMKMTRNARRNVTESTRADPGARV
mmetsp:Transcript_33890/g.57235  ORF Transcript_33890/g.57235 Transcript_33890/m.57235 type:complete len:124 (+) Transcript_33890:106-477(+)